MKTHIGKNEMGIRHNLWPTLENGKYKKKNTNVTFNPAGKKNFLNYNIGRHVKMDIWTVLSLKSHDCYILLQWLLPIVDMDEDIVCIPRENVSSGIFTSMVHVMIHLPNKVKLVGSVHPRWMYPIERYLRNVETLYNKRLCNFHEGEWVENLTVFAQPAQPFGAGHSSEPLIESDLELNSVIQAMYLLFVNKNTRWFESDPYILGNTVKLVLYLDDPKLKGGWKVVQFLIHRNIWNLPAQDGDEDTNNDQDVHDEEQPHCSTTIQLKGAPKIEIDALSIDLGRTPPTQRNSSSKESSDYSSNESDIERDTKEVYGYTDTD
ncbi:hypothetical protein D8674_026183 [Pyrus ussuriensis x Pyrus communis]|uniref:DUF4218 domain-containing protein n=1 Tax=Pyrus ussuriensis x Pyrus communis TaxID=2448454 RepID=A0A5N5I7E3_9ROSA|nr:hypothetical protein D8674_026183 [Pyrus ussuriensis x Pyrus communis]